MWAAIATLGAEALKEDKGPPVTQLPGQPRSLFSDGGDWTVSFGKKPLDLNALPPWVMGAGLVVAGIVAIAAIKVVAK